VADVGFYRSVNKVPFEATRIRCRQVISFRRAYASFIACGCRLSLHAISLPLQVTSSILAVTQLFVKCLANLFHFFITFPRSHLGPYLSFIGERIVGSRFGW